MALALVTACASGPRVTDDVVVGAAVGAVVPGVSVIEGSAVGGAISGLAGAVWSDQNNDGYVDGYTYNGQYYAGTPQGYDPTTRTVLTGALGGASIGAAAGAVIPGISVLRYAVVGAAAGGLTGAVWADRNNDGVVDGYVYNGQYYPGAPSALLPSLPPQPAERGERDEGSAGADGSESLHVGYRSAEWMAFAGQAHMVPMVEIRSAAGARQSVGLANVRPWQTMNGSLAPRALVAILEQCVASLSEVGPDCLAAVRAGTAEFSAVPEAARREFAEIYKDSCSANVSEDVCVEKLQNAAMFRALPRGGLQLSPLKMDEGKRTLFTALIRDSGEIEGQAGLSTNIGFEPNAEHPGQMHRITVVPYSPKMCFDLRADDPSKVKIEPQPGERRTIEQQTRICMTEADEMGAVKYDPSWWVTPLNGDDIKLYLTIEHYVGAVKRDFPQEPWPIVVDVIPKPTWWDRINAFFKHGKEAADNATAFAKALGALFSAVAAWGIWSLFKKWKTARSES